MPEIDTAETLLERARSSGVDFKVEEDYLRKLQDKLRLVCTAPQATLSLSLPNSVLQLTATEQQAFFRDSTYEENSFRAKLTAVICFAAALRAMLQEELALYRIRRKSNYLWRAHRNSLFYVAYRASQILPELESIGQDAKARGLRHKSEDISAMAVWMRRCLSEIDEISASERLKNPGRIEIDPQYEEQRLENAIERLVTVAEQSIEPLATIPLDYTVLPVLPTQWQALAAPPRPGEDSFRASLHLTLRRAVGLLARMQEEVVLYRDNKGNKQVRRRHLNALLYLADCAGEIEPEIKRLEIEAFNRNLTAKGSDLQKTAMRTTEFLDEVARIRSRDASLEVA